jgi:outer membrane immunogenic protein
MGFMKKLGLPTLMGMLCLILWSFTSPSAVAGSYVGFSHGDVGYDESDASLDFSTNTIILGTELSNTFAIEGRYGKGSDDDQIYILDVEIDSVYGLYGKFTLANETSVTPYAIVGYTKGKVKTDYGSDSESDFSYGLGLEFALSESIAVGAEYLVLLDKDDYEFSSANVNLIYSF